MNVGSILNGDSPAEEVRELKKASKPELPPAQSVSSSPPMLHQRHSINNLLNDAPTNPSEHGAAPQRPAASSIDSSAQEAKNESPKTSVSGSSDNKAASSAQPTGEQRKHTNGQPLDNEAINSEFQTLEKLKSEKKKPHRYPEPPVWARQWVPVAQQHRQMGDGARAQSHSDPGLEEYSLSSKPVFDRQAMHATDLECSITGVIPPQATVRTITEWLYANFVDISLENRRFVELELKFGTIINKETGSRINIGVSSECIYTGVSKTRFESAVHEIAWKEMRNFLDELERSYQAELKKDPSKPRRKFASTESNTTDFFYQLTERNEKPKKVRITKDNSLSPPRHVGIHKQRISDLYIHNPSSMHDLRLSLSIEFPISEDSIEPTMKRNKVSLQRGKKRVSYTHAPTVTRFDFTEVSTPKSMKNKAGKTVIENEYSHELELEIDTFQIFRGFDKVRDGSDTIRFEELVEVFLNNARCLNNRVTKLASN